MNDDVKVAVEWLRCVRADGASDFVKARAKELLVHIDALTAERDALAEKWGHAVATADEVTRLTGRSTATIGGLAVESVAEAVKRVVAERDALRAQVERVRAVCEEWDGDYYPNWIHRRQIFDALEGK